MGQKRITVRQDWTSYLIDLLRKEDGFGEKAEIKGREIRAAGINTSLRLVKMIKSGRLSDTATDLLLCRYAGEPKREMKRNYLTDEEKRMLVKIHHKDMSLGDVEELTSIPAKLIGNYWKSLNLKFRKRAKTTRETIAKIYEAHRLLMSISQAKRHSGANKNTISRHWRLAELKPHYTPADGFKFRKQLNASAGSD